MMCVKRTALLAIFAFATVNCTKKEASTHNNIPDVYAVTGDQMNSANGADSQDFQQNTLDAVNVSTGTGDVRPPLGTSTAYPAASPPDNDTVPIPPPAPPKPKPKPKPKPEY